MPPNGAVLPERWFRPKPFDLETIPLQASDLIPAPIKPILYSIKYDEWLVEGGDHRSYIYNTSNGEAWHICRGESSQNISFTDLPTVSVHLLLVQHYCAID